MGGAHWFGMTQHVKQARLATTAIAAALAFASTPLLAQDASPPPVDQPATAPAADPLAPDPTPVETTVAPVETKAEPVAKAKPATTARRTVTKTRSTVTRTATRTAPVATPSAEPAVVPEALPTATDPATAVAPGPMPVADPAPVDETAQATSIDMDEALPIAGGAALGLFMLGGVAAMRRRQRRKQEDADEAAKLAFIDAADHDDMPAEPVIARAAMPQHDPVPAKEPIADAPTTDLPEGFDLSRFGRHVQAAYMGPTEDNPSLSLKHRLRKASFLDLQERRNGEVETADASATIPAKGNWESRTDSDFLFYRAGKKPAPKPEYQN